MESGITETVISVLTLNCWGIPFISKNRKERLEAVADYLSQGLHSIVSLQEIWDKEDFNRIALRVQDVLPHFHYFHSGVLGSGVCVLSKWPIEQVFFHQYALNGYAHMIHHADWFGGKGIGLCKIKYGDLTINFYSAHLHAEYCSNDIYLAHRVIQAYDTAEFIKLTSSSADVVILAGDLNTQPKDLAYKIICTMTGLTDSCLSAKSNEECINKGTNEGAWNSYTNSEEAARVPLGKRIDYILYHSSSNYEIDTVEYDMPILNNVPGYDFSYSDHDAVTAKLLVEKLRNKRDIETNITESLAVMEVGASVCVEAISTLSSSRKQYLLLAFTITFLLCISIPLADGSTLMGVMKLFMLFILFYFIFMGTLWNNMEYNGVLSAHSGMTKFIQFHKVHSHQEDI